MTDAPLIFKDRLRLLREERGWSQIELANIAGISQSTISLYEAGRREPDRARICKLALAFGLTPETLTALICPELLALAAA